MDDLYTKERFATRLKAARKARGWSQSTLAKRAGYKHYQQIQNFESGTVNITLDSMQRCARGLGLSLHELLYPEYALSAGAQVVPMRAQSAAARKAHHALLAEAPPQA